MTTGFVEVQIAEIPMITLALDKCSAFGSKRFEEKDVISKLADPFLKFPSWQFLYDINAPLSQLSLCMARFDNLYIYIYILYELNVKGKGKHGRIRLDRFIGEPG